MIVPSPLFFIMSNYFFSQRKKLTAPFDIGLLYAAVVDDDVLFSYKLNNAFLVFESFEKKVNVDACDISFYDCLLKAICNAISVNKTL